MRAVFAHVARDPIKPINTLLMASAHPLYGTLAQAAPAARALRRSPATQRPASPPPLRGGQVFTDDRAPVEWLIDTSIVKYAAGESK